MEDILRIRAGTGPAKISNGEALLVCAYEDPSSFRSMRLDGAISIEEFRERLPSLGDGEGNRCYCA